MPHKSLNILIQPRFSKFHSINDFDLTSGLKDFFGSVSFLDELFLHKLNVNNTKNKQKHAQNHFYTNVG